MNLTFGTLRPREELEDSGAVTVAYAAAAAHREAVPPLSPARIARPEVVEAARTAERLLSEAERRASELRAQAEAELSSLRARVVDEARAEGAAALAERTLALAAIEAKTDERARDRWVELARLLAERLLGEALTLDPSRVAALAETAVAEARGARHITLVAHPEDVPLLESALSRGGLRQVTRVVGNAERARGSLRLETEIGVLDAAVAPQLDRLAARLRESLHHER